MSRWDAVVSFGCAAAIGAHRTRKRVLDKLPRRGAGLEKWRIEDKHAAKMEFGAEFYEGDSYILLAVNIAHAVAQLLVLWWHLCGYCGVVFVSRCWSSRLSLRCTHRRWRATAPSSGTSTSGKARTRTR